MTERRMFFNMKLFFFFAYFGFGGLFPLLSVYLQEDIGLRGSQIGVITSIGPIVMILIQPLWGMASDVTKKPRILLTVSAVGAGLTGFSYLFAEQYALLVAIAAGVAVFQSAIIPLSDSMAMYYVQQKGGDYGSIRMWGAAGFALSVWLMGNLSDRFGLEVIFFGFAFVLFLSAWFASGMPGETSKQKVDLRGGLKKLVKIPQFNVFLLVTFLVFGPIMANNFYFGLFIQFAGGSLAGVGFAFLLAAGSEVPFMRLAGSWIRKRGILVILLAAASASGVRWLFYATGPEPTWIYWTTVIQGFSIGLFVPAALQYVADLAPRDVKATAVSIYSAVGNGLGAWFFSMTAGMIMEWFSILSVYLFYGVMTLTGAALTFGLLSVHKKSVQTA
ncbi:MFS transporter [Salisediminibacterium halotolerans]|uniref:MFS transporter n=1 Tax=Salisediminibacterium halotolerans TaxID=517425 RepID=UPI000EABF44B|nr:MFS transporter [Salisediminibacterium halotolerans]RLJ69417.1 PPP family 3-phenylpropionic acid transporter [Actinophytocola xinjiangensis]RPE83957.1 PPP family 3-phenylpropionic acid transporter [Salisediminibacterium halotolerans]TWG32492.1 PPP family 3-phenylpropionic acid transporter [Salisediminibacterium halotolerans]GEL07667.1 putative transporter YwbF [Salisediminibacterium halotolerans]